MRFSEADEISGMEHSYQLEQNPRVLKLRVGVGLEPKDVDIEERLVEQDVRGGVAGKLPRVVIK